MNLYNYLFIIYSMNKHVEKNFNDDDYIIEVEKIILSSILNKHREIDEIFLHLAVSDFIKIEHKIIFKNALDFRNNNKEIDYVSLIYQIKNVENILDIDFYEGYLASLYANYSYDQNISQLIEIIKNASIKRKIVDFSETLKETDLDIINAQEKLWELEKEFADIAGSKKSQEIEGISKILDDFNKKLLSRKEQSDELEVVKSGYENIDALTNGFGFGDLVILAARPGIGKTTLAINFLISVAKNLKVKNEENEKKESKEKEQAVLMFSIEMGREQICQRMLSITSNVNPTKKNLSATEESALHYGIISLKSLPIYIDDSSDLTLIDIQSKLKQISNTKEIKLVVLDYLQLLKASTKNSPGMNRQQEVAEISRTLKKLARQFKIPIISIAQLSRRIEERKGGPNSKPMLSDLRESGSIEQDADMVCFINYVTTEEDDSFPEINIDGFQKNSLVDVEFILAKNRNGATGSCFLTFDKEHSLFLEKAK